MDRPEPIQAELVMLGGGHAQVQLLKSFGMKPVAAVQLTLVTDVLETPYSGMLPGFVEGVWPAPAIHIDLVRLAAFAGARLIHAPAVRIDQHRQLLHINGRPPLHWDILSINCGAAQDLSSLKGAEQWAIPVKPIAHFIRHLPDGDEMSGPIAVIGGGPAGAELALALASRYQRARPAIHLISKSDRLVPAMPARAAAILERSLRAAGVQLHLDNPAREVSKAGIHLKDGQFLPAAHKFMVTPTRPPEFIKNSGLAMDEDGWLQVGPTLQSLSDDRIFAAGDIASVIGQKREKAGVFAVRAGPVLDRNIRAMIAGRSLKKWRPQSGYLSLIGLGNGDALAVRGQLAVAGKPFWLWKKYIDRRFMDRFSILPEMDQQDYQPLGLNRQMPDATDPVLHAMRCVGCGAKAGPGTLSDALAKAVLLAREMGADPAFLPVADQLSDAASLPAAPPGHQLVQSIDALAEMIPDPFLFGRIAALHALSDLFVSGARPAYALALVQSGYAARRIQPARLVQLLAGAMIELARAGVLLAGGHTMEAPQTSLGFAVTGWQKPSPRPPLPDEASLILTKPLGSGLLLAAHMRGKLPAKTYQGLLDNLLLSNQAAAGILADCGAIRMTDVTGFGLARHGLGLLDGDHGAGLVIWPDALPMLAGTSQLLSSDISTSLAAQNQDGLAMDTREISDADRRDAIIKLVCDPQTAGGVLALLPPAAAQEACDRLVASGYEQACVIGRLLPAFDGIKLAGKPQ